MTRDEAIKRVQTYLCDMNQYDMKLYKECIDILNGDDSIVDMIASYYMKFSKTTSADDNLKSSFKYNLQQKYGYHFAVIFKRLADDISRKIYISDGIKECHCGELYKNYIHYDGSILGDYLLAEFIKIGSVKHYPYQSYCYSAIYVREDFEDRFIYKDCYIVELEDDYLILKPNQFHQLFAET